MVLELSICYKILLSNIKKELNFYSVYSLKSK